MYFGDLSPDGTLEFLFTTEVGADPTTVTDGLLVLYGGGGLVFSADESLLVFTPNIDGQTGLHHVAMNLSDLQVVPAADYTLVFTALLGSTRIRRVVANFSVLNRSVPNETLIVPTAEEIAITLLALDLQTVNNPADRSMVNALRFLRNKWTIANGTLTVMREDDQTPAWTAVVRETSGGSITSIDPEGPAVID